MTSIRSHKGFMFLLYILVFLLLAEWLTPVISLTATGYKPLFLLFIGISLLMMVVRVPYWVSGPLKLLYILWFLVHVYTDGPFFSSEGAGTVLRDIQANLAALFSQNWAETTDVFRTLLFFALLWMASYLIHYWVSFRLSIFLFYLLTVVFVAVLDTFSPYSGDTAIIRIMVLGLLLAGLLHLARWMEQHRIPLRAGAILSWTVPLFLMLAVSTAFALYLPKADPIWPDPVPYFKSYSGGSGLIGAGPGSVGRIGYSQDDSRLGGSFIGDDTVVFRANVPDGQYWKIESKDVYTTKGWELSESAEDPSVYGNEEPLPLDIPAGEAENREAARITMQEVRFPFVLYPYGTESFRMDEPAEYRYNPADQRIGTYQADSTFEPVLYEVAYSEPSYSLTALRATDPQDLQNLPPGFDRYLQLPEALPARVGELAAGLTESEETVYDKARAIEGYFSNSHFEYSQQDVPVPEPDQDYVDQFLFETQKGYCDNFSTAMVVMLRTQGIPARWVKGFNQGEEIRLAEGSIYEITNNNAHSWVEAYMPGVGWMVFEPTIGFTNASNIEFDLELDPADAPDAEVPAEPELERPDASQADSANAESGGPSLFENLSVTWSKHKGLVIGFVLLTSALCAVLYFIRRKWLPKVLIPYYRMRGSDARSFEKAYLRLLNQLSLYGIERKEGQTLSAYAAYIDSFFGTRDMSRLTKAYERAVYGGDQSALKWDQLRKSWEYLINRTGG